MVFARRPSFQNADRNFDVNLLIPSTVAAAANNRLGALMKGVSREETDVSRVADGGKNKRRRRKRPNSIPARTCWHFSDACTAADQGRSDGVAGKNEMKGAHAPV